MEARGINVHPCLATVTYLSANGGPTVILDKKVSVLHIILQRFRVLLLMALPLFLLIPHLAAVCLQHRAVSRLHVASLLTNVLFIQPVSSFRQSLCTKPLSLKPFSTEPLSLKPA